MPNIIQSFQGRDIGYLRIVARLWGIELAASDTDTVLKELAAALLDPKLVTEIVDSLPADAMSALEALAKADGKLPWAAFARRFGEIREAGPGRRDREQIYLHPVSAAEVLFYLALLARAFFDMPAGAQEFAYIPDDLIPLIHHKGHDPQRTGASEHKGEKDKTLVSFVPFVVKQGDEPLGRLASPKEREHPLPASDRLLDDATTLLAALRMGLPPPETRIPSCVVTEFLSAAKIILPSPRGGWAGGGVPQIEPVRLFLEAPRKDALEKLVNAWLKSETFNELCQVPSLVCEGEWSNQPLVTREFMLTLLEAIPENNWWNLPAFIRAIKEKYPDFQRPAGDYDSWFIKRVVDGVYLRGFGVWDEVDGALIRYLITGPLYGLGQVELATPAGNDIVSAFRSANNKSRITNAETARLHVSSQGKIVIPRLLPRAARYQIARFCEWDEEKPDEYRYRVTTGSLKKAGEQGLKVNQLLSLLAKNAAAEIPPTFVRALKRWELNGTEARVEVQTVLRVSRPEVLEELRKSKAGRFLGETLGPVTIVVKPGAQSKVLAALAELGLLAENLTTTPKELGQADTTSYPKGKEHKGEN
ncbi:MAG: helicase-associated domain-containing protein [Candidatus Atribacteria bacterium]|nr:helicase-associated domain-containing protein [Candidatus Atribacteria bacterium]